MMSYTVETKCVKLWVFAFISRSNVPLTMLPDVANDKLASDSKFKIS